MEVGLFERQPVEPLARLVVGALQEAARFIAAADDSRRAIDEIRPAVERLLGGLRPAAP